MTLSEKFISELKDTNKRMELALAIGKSYATLTRWYLNEPERFATLKVISAITKVTGLTQEEIFEPEQVKA